MRSIVSTFLLSLLALALFGLVGWRLTQGNLDVIFGAPPTPTGNLLYTDFKPGQVHRIYITGSGVKGAEFVFDKAKGWRTLLPQGKEDRMDPYFAAAIINFTLSTRVAESIPHGKIGDKQAGFGEDVIVIRLEGENGAPLCKYMLGRTTQWIGKDPESGEDVPTVFVRTLDKTRKNFVYACTGDIHPIFRDGLRYLRDHQPFLFNYTQLERIHIRTTAGELTVARPAPDQPWRITKPLDLATDANSMFRLIQGLIRLRAVKVSDSNAVTLPAKGAAAGSEEIGVHLFGMAQDIVLEILPPQTPDATTRLATVSDRPGVIFDLPAKGAPDAITLSNLPLKVNDLRDTTLSHLNVGAVTGIVIQPTGRPDIVLTRQPHHWQLGDGESRQNANDWRLNDLLQAVTKAKITGFVTDAASDFSQWGLDQPFLKLHFQAGETQSLDLAFGKDKAGTVFVNRGGTPSVVKVDDEILSKIATRAYEWRGSQLWSVNAIDTKGIRLEKRGQPPVELGIMDSGWSATRGGRDATAELDTRQADHLLEALGKLQVNRWLPRDDPGASTALLNPVLVVQVRAVIVDPETSEEKGTMTRELRIAPAVESATNRFFYGYLNTDPYPFMLDSDSIANLNGVLFTDEE